MRGKTDFCFCQAGQRVEISPRVSVMLAGDNVCLASLTGVLKHCASEWDHHTTTYCLCLIHMLFGTSSLIFL